MEWKNKNTNYIRMNRCRKLFEQKESQEKQIQNSDRRKPGYYALLSPRSYSAATVEVAVALTDSVELQVAVI